MSLKSHQKFQNTDSVEDNKKFNRTGQIKGNNNNNKALIINKLPNSVDTSELAGNLKNCSCGKTIVVDLIKCSCNNFSELGLKEYNNESIHGSVCNEYGEYNKRSNCDGDRLKLKKNEHKYSCVKKNEDIDENDKYIINVGCEPESLGGLGDKISKWDGSTKEKKLKVLVKIKQPKEAKEKLGPVTNIDFRIRGTDDQSSCSTDNYSRKKDENNNKNKINRGVPVIENQNSKFTNKQLKPSNTSLTDDEDFHSMVDPNESVGGGSSQVSYEVLQRNNNAGGNESIEEGKMVNKLHSLNLTSTPAQKIPGYMAQQRQASGDKDQNQDDADEVEEKPPQKLTLNTQIKLKIYQNENGEVAVQQINSQSQCSRVSSRINTKINPDGLSMESFLTKGGKQESQTSVCIRNDKINILDSQNRPIYKRNNPASSTSNNNNNNNNFICDTKHFYVKQKKLSSINNKILVYEEKEMQMSETSTIISEQDLNEYKNNGNYFITKNNFNNNNNIVESRNNNVKKKEFHINKNSDKTNNNNINSTSRRMKSPEYIATESDAAISYVAKKK